MRSASSLGKKEQERGVITKLILGWFGRGVIETRVTLMIPTVQSTRDIGMESRKIYETLSWEGRSIFFYFARRNACSSC